MSLPSLPIVTAFVVHRHCMRLMSFHVVFVIYAWADYDPGSCNMRFGPFL